MGQRQQKQRIREELLARRRSLSQNTYLQKSEQIVHRLKQLSAFKQAATIHCYVSMNDRKEVNTHPLLQEMLDDGKKVVVPITQIEDGTLRHIALYSFGQLKANRWGVLEPVDGAEVPLSNLQLVVVPMAGGDLQKNRIGYGKGFYDRFLKQLSCPSAGLLFEECLVKQLPTESFDIPLDLLVTEQNVID